MGDICKFLDSSQLILWQTLGNTESDTKEGSDESKMNSSQSIGDGIYKCDPCNFETKWSQSLQAHFKTFKHISNAELATEEAKDSETDLRYHPYIT